MFKKPLIIEDSEILNDADKLYINSIIPNFKWEYTSATTTLKFPQLSHPLVYRPSSDFSFWEHTEIKILSLYYNFLKDLVDKFCIKHNIKYSNIIRANINKTWHIPNFIHGDPHIDFTKPHYVLLIYMSEGNSKSSTLIFDKHQKFDRQNEIFDISNNKNSFKVKKEIRPEFGKICLFDGVYYHSNKIPQENETRIVCVFNLLK